MRAASVVVVLSLFTACAGDQARRTRRHAELGIGISLIGVIAGSLSIAAFPSEKPTLIPITVALGGLAVASAIVFGIAYSNEPAAVPPAPPPSPPEGRAEAWSLTQQAQAAARADDCATVTSLDARVRALDAELHATVFARDAAIARCLAR